MPYNGTQKEILATIANDGIAATNAILAIGGSHRYIYTLINRLVELGLLKDREFALLYKGYKYKYKVSYKAITKRGLQWLIDNASDEYEWLKYLPQPLPDFLHTKAMSNANVFRNLCSITASVMFSEFGINTALPVKEPKDAKAITDRVNYRDMITDAKLEARYKTNNKTVIDKLAKDEHIYFQSRDIANYFALTREEVNQYAFSNHIGLLISDLKFYIVYCTSQKGLLLRTKVVKRIQLFAASFLRQRGIFNSDYNSYGIVLCKNSKEYEKFVRDNYDNMNKAVNIIINGQGLSSVFSKLYIVPITQDGMYLLDNILLYKDELWNEIIEKLKAIDCDFTSDIIYSNRIYKLTYKNNPVYVGIDMEQCSLQKLLKDAYSSVSDPNRLHWIRS